MITVARWKRTRHWSVTRNGELIAVTVYKRGADTVAALLEQLEALQELPPSMRTAEDNLELARIGATPRNPSGFELPPHRPTLEATQAAIANENATLPTAQQ